MIRITITLRNNDRAMGRGAVLAPALYAIA
jgi:hypothetical protein